MNTMLQSARSFLEGISQEELSDWFQKGAKTYYDKKVADGDKAVHQACLSGAFEQMSLTLGNSQHRTTLSEEFKDIYPQFSKELQGKFQLALGESVKKILTQGGSIESCNDLIDLALEIQYEEMADILAEYLPKIDDVHLKNATYLQAVFFFEEAINPDSTSRLMQVCFDDPNVPQEIFLKLIVARVRIGTTGILNDLKKLDTDKVRSAYNVIKKYPDIVGRFSKDLEDACKKANIQVAEILGIIELDTAK